MCETVEAEFEKDCAIRPFTCSSFLSGPLFTNDFSGNGRREKRGVSRFFLFFLSFKLFSFAEMYGS